MKLLRRSRRGNKQVDMYSCGTSEDGISKSFVVLKDSHLMLMTTDRTAAKGMWVKCCFS